MRRSGRIVDHERDASLGFGALTVCDRQRRQLEGDQFVATREKENSMNSRRILTAAAALAALAITPVARADDQSSAMAPELASPYSLVTAPPDTAPPVQGGEST